MFKEKKRRWSAAEVDQFCGWEFLKEMYEMTKTKRTKDLIVGGFLTGGRIAKEILMLESTHFDFNIDPDVVLVRAMPVSKRYEKIREQIKWKCQGHCKMRWGSRQRPREPNQNERDRHEIVDYSGWVTRLKTSYRSFPFPKTEMFVDRLKQITQAKTGRLYDFGYSTAYNELTAIGKELGTWIPTHWFRAQRASQLALEYDFGVQELSEFFDWKDYRTALIYARKGYKGLAKKMIAR